jgi:hypothetical protein
MIGRMILVWSKLILKRFTNSWLVDMMHVLLKLTLLSLKLEINLKIVVFFQIQISLKLLGT